MFVEMKREMWPRTGRKPEVQDCQQVRPRCGTLSVGNPGLDCKFCHHFFSFKRKKRKLELSACIIPLLIQTNGEATSGPWKEACSQAIDLALPRGKPFNFSGSQFPHL